MATRALDRLGRLGRFVWAGWTGLAALALLACVWQIGHEAYGDFILPGPLATLRAAVALLGQPKSWAIAAETTRRALGGFFVAAGVSGALGLLAGYSPAALRLARPLVTVMLGVPPIAWIVLTMIWFGSTHAMILATVVVAAAPIVFIGAAEGVATRDRGLDAMARAFGAGPVRRLATLGLRHAAAHVLPAFAIALGMAFKVAVMAELLANTGGIGGTLAGARANLDVAEALAWVFIAVAVLIVVEYGLVHPARAELERWRAAAAPWGVKR